MTQGRTGSRDELSRRLRALRQAAGLSGVEAAQRLDATQSRLSRTENGRVVASPEFVDQLCRLYGTSAAERRELVRMARDVKGNTKRLVMARDSAAIQARIGRIIRQSRLIRCFSPTAIPGELQTPAYARAVFETDPRADVEAVEAGVRQRLHNQRLLDDPAREFRFLIPESALGWSLLPAIGMADQADRLAVERRDNVSVGIIPWGMRVPCLALNSWSVYDRRFVVAGSPHGTACLDDPPDVDPYVHMTDQIDGLAVFGDEARAILERTAQRYRTR